MKDYCTVYIHTKGGKTIVIPMSTNDYLDFQDFIYTKSSLPYKYEKENSKCFIFQHSIDYVEVIAK